MRALVVAVALVALVADARDRMCKRDRASRTGDCVKRGGYAFFEAFPASGAGAGTACACSAVTGAKGETLTFSRASTQTCTKTVGVEPQAIANGDLVSCASGQPAVMPGADGTGVSGLLVEGAATNLLVRSEEFNNAAWTKAGAAGVPVVTADFGVAPDGTTTADRIQFAACPTASTTSEVSQAGTNAVNSEALFIKGNGTSGSISLCLYNTGAACAVCAFNSTAWTWCKRPASGTGSTMSFGCINNTAVYPGSSNTGAADILAWGADMETGPVPTSYIPTGATTASRVAVVSTGPATLAGNVISIGETWLLPSTITASASAFTVAKDASNYVVGYASGGAFVCDFVIGGVTSSVTGSALTAGTSTRVACTYDAVGRSACVNGACTTTAGVLTLFSGASSFYFGTRTATGNEARNVVKRACLDQVSASRCVL